MSWSEAGPISTPPRSLVTLVAIVLAGVAVFSVGYGVRATMRAGGPAAAGSGDQGLDSQASIAKPLVDIPAVEQPPVATNAAPPAAANAAAAAKEDDEDDANSVAEKTAAAQAAQSKPAQQPTDIDQMMASPSEKPQAAAKPSADESAPGSPTNSVPF